MVQTAALLVTEYADSSAVEIHLQMEIADLALHLKKRFVERLVSAKTVLAERIWM